MPNRDDQINRIIIRAVSTERWWRAQYLRLDRVIIQLQNLKVLPVGQLTFDFNSRAA